MLSQEQFIGYVTPPALNITFTNNFETNSAPYPTRSSPLLSSFCSLPFERKGKGRKFGHETCPSSRASRVRFAPLTRPKSPLRSFQAPATQASFLAVSPRFSPSTMELGHSASLLKMELMSQKYSH